VKDVTPLLRGRIYSGLASAQAVLGQKQDALRHIGLAYEEFPERPENDRGFLYTYTTHYILHFNEACAYLDFKQPQQAWDALAQAATFVPNEVSPRGLELQNYRVIISIAKGDMDQSCTHFEKMVASGLALNSDLHQNEAHTAYEKMQLKWPHEKRVSDLEDLLRRERRTFLLERPWPLAHKQASVPVLA
jgi:tetratricopeptide (TPR) repeat protein